MDYVIILEWITSSSSNDSLYSSNRHPVVIVWYFDLAAAPVSSLRSLKAVIERHAVFRRVQLFLRQGG